VTCEWQTVTTNSRADINGDPAVRQTTKQKVGFLNIERWLKQQAVFCEIVLTFDAISTVSEFDINRRMKASPASEKRESMNG
jgi:ABC-type uncharacterized transport system ATPase subunit